MPSSTAPEFLLFFLDRNVFLVANLFKACDMMATLEHLRIVNGALTSCKTADEIAHNVKLPMNSVTECLDTLKSMGVISKDSYSDTYCPIEEVAGNICRQCNKIVEDLGGDKTDRNRMQDKGASEE